MAQKIVVTVEHLRGKCRYWKVGDKIVLWRGKTTRLLGLDYKLSDGRGACLAGLMSLYPFLLGPIETWDGKTPCNRFRCPDASDEFDGRGGVTFRADFTGEEETIEGMDEEPHLEEPRS
jgi:uncharacterized repeat protein (TIGR04076 family)